MTEISKYCVVLLTDNENTGLRVPAMCVTDYRQDSIFDSLEEATNFLAEIKTKFPAEQYTVANVTYTTPTH